MKKLFIVLLHLGYWMMYLLLLATLYILLIAGTPRFIATHERAILFFAAFAFVPAVLSFYTFYTLLFTRLLSRKRFGLLALAGGLVALASSLIGWLLLDLLWPLIAVQSHGRPSLIQGPLDMVLALLFLMSVNTLANGIIGLVTRGFITWYGDIRLKESLRRRNEEMELALLKSQLNPHFLFNTINNIDVLINRDPSSASDYLNKLSDMLRFMLYETPSEEIVLAKELSYIGKYIDLQKIRTANPDYVHYIASGDPAAWTIAPMLFIPFIENAFKHAENKRLPGAIAIRITIRNEQITFECENNYSIDTQSGLGHNGLGNELIRKRLKLLYPGRHLLSIDKAEDRYRVRLLIGKGKMAVE